MRHLFIPVILPLPSPPPPSPLLPLPFPSSLSLSSPPLPLPFPSSLFPPPPSHFPFSIRQSQCWLVYVLSSLQECSHHEGRHRLVHSLVWQSWERSKESAHYLLSESVHSSGVSRWRNKRPGEPFHSGNFPCHPTKPRTMLSLWS